MLQTVKLLTPHIPPSPAGSPTILGDPSAHATPDGGDAGSRREGRVGKETSREEEGARATTTISGACGEREYEGHKELFEFGCFGEESGGKQGGWEGGDIIPLGRDEGLSCMTTYYIWMAH